MVSIIERIKQRRERKKREKAFEAGKGEDFSAPRAIVPDSDGGTKTITIPTAEESFVGPTSPTPTPDNGRSGGGGTSVTPSTTTTFQTPEEFKESTDFVGPQPQATTGETLKEQVEGSKDVSRADLRQIDDLTISREGEVVPRLQPTPDQPIVTAGGIDQFGEDVTLRQRLSRTGLGGLFTGLITKDLETFEKPIQEEVAFTVEPEGTSQRRDVRLGELQAEIEIQRQVEFENLQKEIEKEELQKSQERIDDLQKLIQKEIDEGITPINRAQERLDNLIESEQETLNKNIESRFLEESRDVFERRPDIRPDIRGTSLITEAQAVQTVFDIGTSLNPVSGASVAAARTTQTPGFLTLPEEQLRQERIEQSFLIGGSLGAVSGTIPRLGREFVEAGVQESLALARFGRRGVTGVADDISVSLTRGAGRTTFGDVSTTRTLLLSQVDDTGRIISRGVELSAVSPRDIAGRPFGTIITAQEFGARTGVETLESGLQVAVSEVTGRPLFQQTTRLGRRGRTIESFRQFDEKPTRQAFLSLFQRGEGGVQLGVGGRLRGVQVETLEGTGFRIPQQGDILFDIEGAGISRPVRLEPEPQPRRFRRDRRTKISLTEETPQEIIIEPRRGTQIPDETLRQIDELQPQPSSRIQSQIQQAQEISLTNLQPVQRNIISRRTASESVAQLLGVSTQVSKERQKSQVRQGQIPKQFELVSTRQAQVQRQGLRQRQIQRQLQDTPLPFLGLTPFITQPSIRGRGRGLPPGLPIPPPRISFRPGKSQSELIGGTRRGVSPTFTGGFLELEEELIPVSETQGLFVAGKRSKQKSNII